MTLARLLRIGLELAWDLVTGKLERSAPEPMVSPYTHADVERMARASRDAGPTCPRTLPTHERCTLRRGHAGRCRFVPRRPN